MNSISYAFFGTSHIAVYVLDELLSAGLRPALIVTMPDAPKGRGHALAAPAIKERALQLGIDILQPEHLDADFMEIVRERGFDVCVVCDYGKILPKELLTTAKKGFLNVHPSLLPRLRGASPMRSAILNDEKHTGVSIMLVDEKMDHGPLVSQKAMTLEPWPPRIAHMEEALMREGGRLLARMLPLWCRGDIEAREQNHDVATYCVQFKKEDGLLDLGASAHTNMLKIRAFEGWPGTYTFFERDGKRIRTKILDAHVEQGSLVIDRVIPEGKKEMAYEDFLRSGARIATP